MNVATSTKTHTGASRAQRGGKQVVNHGAAASDADYKLIPTLDVVPSKTNPRKHYDETKLLELAASVAEKGIIEPLIVRTLKGRPGKFEIVAGERRHRAAKIATLASIPCLVRTLNDGQAREIQLIENLFRTDLTPLEEAAGFRALIDTNPDKHSATTIAARIGKSPQWVWDLMKLLDLVPEGKKLLDEELITLNHAIPIARLKPEQQNRVITSGLFVDEHASFKFDDDQAHDKAPGKYDRLKAKTVREVTEWIARYIRFDVKHAAQAVPLQFEEVAAKVEEAAVLPGRGKKVIAITRLSYVQPEAKDESDKTFLDGRWARADGSAKTTFAPPNKWVDSPECEHSVMGVVVVGPGQGEAFKVCIAREKCEVHWAKEIKKKTANASLKKAGSSGAAGKATKKPQWQIDQERAEELRRKRDERFSVFGPALKKATIEKLEKLPPVLPKAVFAELLKDLQLPKTTKPANLGRALLTLRVKNQFSFMNAHHEPSMVRWAKALRVNVKACEPKKEKKVQTAGAKKKPAK
jgi:ParB/RepB/Spo0J family partition protein